MMIGGYKCTAGRADDDFAFAASAKLCCAGWRGLLKVHRKACDEARWQGARAKSPNVTAKMWPSRTHQELG